MRRILARSRTEHDCLAGSSWVSVQQPSHQDQVADPDRSRTISDAPNRRDVTSSSYKPDDADAGTSTSYQVLATKAAPLWVRRRRALLPPNAEGTRSAAWLTSLTTWSSMHEQPSQPSTSPVPQLFVDSAPAPGLTSSLNSMVVHVLEGRASAEVRVVSPLKPPMPRVGVEATRVAIDLPSGVRAFSGKLTQVETRMEETGAPSKVLYARGTAPEGASDSAVPLHIGAELVSGSVLRSAERSHRPVRRGDG